MTTEPYDELGGLARGGPYDANGAITRACPDCGAEAGARCTFEARYYSPRAGRVVERKYRHIPCKARLTHETETRT